MVTGKTATPLRIAALSTTARNIRHSAPLQTAHTGSSLQGLHCRLDELDGLLAALSCTVRTPLLTVFFILVLYTPVYSLLFLYCSEIQGPLNAQEHSPPRVGGGRCGAADGREALSS